MKPFRSVLTKPVGALLAAVALGHSPLGEQVDSAAPAPGNPGPTVRSPTALTRPADPGPAAANARTVAVDPATKQTRPPTPPKAKAPSQARTIQGSGQGSSGRVRRDPNGTVSALLPESHLHVLSVTVNPDGTLSYHCLNAKDTLEAEAASTADVGPAIRPAARGDRPGGLPASPASPKPATPAEEKPW